MKTNSPKDSAFKSLDVYLSAMQDPDYLRVNKSGDVERASDVVVLFNRANRYLKRAIDKNYSPTDWKSKAYEAITKKLNAEMMSARGKLSQEDTQLLQNLLKNISDSSPSQWQNNISNEISLLKQKNQELAAALEKILFIGRPENSTLFPYVRNQINKSETREGSLELGLAEYLKGEFGYEEVSAKKAAKTMAYVMKNYGSSVKEALSVVSYAGELSLKKAIIAPEKRALPVAFLKLDFGLSLNDANDLYDQINNAKKTIAESKPYIEVMRIFSVGVDKAKLITEKAQEIIDKNTLAPPVSTISSATQKKEALMPAFIQIEVIEAYQIDSNDAKNIYNESRFLKNDWRLKSLSDLQLAEIAWLTSCKKINPEEAILISLRAGRFTDSIPNNRIEQLNKTKNSLNEEINAAFERSSPAGWPDRWELMPDGSRRLTDKKKFEEQYMQFLNDNIKDAQIDDAQGLSIQFLKDVGRSLFKFGSGKNSIKIQFKEKEAIENFKSLIPDGEVLKNISKVANQSGQNGFPFAMGHGLSRNNSAPFIPIALVEESNRQPEGVSSWISVQLMPDDGKIRIAHTVFFKHFSLIDPVGFVDIPINPQCDASTSPSADDHTAKANAVLELDIDELQRGITNPKFVRPPELSLRIEFDRETYMKRLIRKELKIP